MGLGGVFGLHTLGRQPHGLPPDACCEGHEYDVVSVVAAVAVAVALAP
eukprot:COSAG01_NODE_62871_length_282_cov_1.136612_2_plen_47_part_01